MTKGATPATHPITINPVSLAQLRQALCEVGTDSLRKFLIEVFMDDDLRCRVLMDGTGGNIMVRMWSAAKREPCPTRCEPERSPYFHPEMSLSPRICN
jgi:hypothetical protein